MVLRKVGGWGMVVVRGNGRGNRLVVRKKESEKG